MKNLFKAFAFTAVLSAAFTACNNDPCKDVVCGDQGACDEGTCICNRGYEKDTANLCNLMIRSKYLGAGNGSATYSIAEVCGGVNSGGFTMTVTAASDILDIAVANFGDSGQSVVMMVTGSRTLQVKPGQTINGIAVSGDGELDANGQLVIRYTGTDATTGAQVFSCTMTGTKQ